MRNKAAEIKEIAEKNITRALFAAIKAIYGLSTSGPIPGKSEDGTLLKNPTEIDNRLQEHIKELLKRECDVDVSVFNHVSIRRVKEHLAALLEMEELLVMIFKVGDRSECGNYRGISLLSIMGKIITRILLNRLLPFAEELLPESQCGLRPQRATTDMIFAARQMQ